MQWGICRCKTSQGVPPLPPPKNTYTPTHCCSRVNHCSGVYSNVANDIGEVWSTSGQPLRVIIVKGTEIEPIGINGRPAKERGESIGVQAMNCVVRITIIISHPAFLTWLQNPVVILNTKSWPVPARGASKLLSRSIESLLCSGLCVWVGECECVSV